MQKEKVRVYSLARELNMDSKVVLDLCRQLGFDVKNQLSSLDPEQKVAVEQVIKKGGSAVALATAPAKPVIPSVAKPVPVLPTRARVAPLPASRPEAETSASELAPEPEPSPIVEEPVAAPAAAVAPSSPLAAAASAAPAPLPPAKSAPTVSAPVEAAPAPRPDAATRVPDLSSRPLNRPAAQKPDDAGQRRRREVPRPMVGVRFATPPPLKPKTVEAKKPEQPAIQKPISKHPELLTGGTVNAQDIINKSLTPQVPAGEVSEEDDDRKGKARPGVAGRDKRHQQRANRAKQRKGTEVDTRNTRLMITTLDDDRPQRTKERMRRLKEREKPRPRQGKIPIELPITIRALSEAIGKRAAELLFKLRDQGAPASININSTIEVDVAETLALEAGIELDFRKPFDAEQMLIDKSKAEDTVEELVPRAPIVTIMGHVDHGKTSLLDKIRKSNVVATEAGGITQVLRAWRVAHDDKFITFLDTPGHEAFTKMRARGAQVTDVAVIVVAADDGVMPQTEEAINHAKAAGVSLVVAINKVDLPNANLNKTKQQLYGMNVLPDNMGGDTPFVETSAATGKGIDELLTMLSIVADLKELKANPKRPATGICLEAMLSEGEGVRATFLVQNGTLHKGDILLCGHSYGRVRAMYDDLGLPIEEAGPSVPVLITGLDVVPNADDPFLVVPDLAEARSVAEQRKSRMQVANVVQRVPVRLESLGEAKIDELKVILKADFRGSIEAIKKELEKLYHAEVRVRVLHTAIGGITESDVQLALTSPEDTIIVGFNVVPDDRALQLAEEKAVQIKQYNIIYNLTDDIRSALEGKLKPREEVVHLGRALVRKTFKISRVGTIAGCFVTQGTIERSAKIRVIRDGVVIYPPHERTAGLESLKRVKDDAREVREGFECGIKIAGYDDIKDGDVIEAFRVEQVQRTL